MFFHKSSSLDSEQHNPPLCGSHRPDTFPLSNNKTCPEVGAILGKSSFFSSLEMNVRILLLQSTEVYFKKKKKAFQFRDANVRP